MKRKLYLLLLVSILFLRNVNAHDWTYHVTSTDSKEFYMWTPYIKHVRGIILTTKVNYIGGICADTALRRICAEEQLVIVAAFNPSWGGAPNPVTASMFTELQNGLKALATQSGYPEVEFAPICIHGHSTEGLAAIRIAAYKPSRFFGVIMENAIINNDDITANTRVNTVPMISCRGAEEYRISGVSDLPWSATRGRILGMRTNNELANMIIQPGAGHFGYYTFKSQYIAKWVKKAAQKLIPAATYATTGEITLLSYPQTSGVLIEAPDTLTSAKLSAITPMTYSDYVLAGKDPKLAFWHFDMEMANYWKTIHLAEENKTACIIRFNNGSYAVNGAWVNRVTLSSFTSTMDIAATSTPAGLPIKYTLPWATANVSGSVITPSACKRPIFGNNDWGLAYFDGNATYRVTEQAQWLKINPSATNVAFTYSDIPNKTIAAAPFAFGATYSGNAAGKFIVSGAIKANGTNLEIEQFYKGVSTAEVCYEFQANRSNPTDLFNITWTTGVWSDPGEYPTPVNAVANNSYLALAFPNPSNGLFSIDVENKICKNITVIDVTGKVVYSDQPNTDGKIAVNALSLSEGIYILQLTSGNIVSSQLIIIKK